MKQDDLAYCMGVISDYPYDLNQMELRAVESLIKMAYAMGRRDYAAEQLEEGMKKLEALVAKRMEVK